MVTLWGWVFLISEVHVSVGMEQAKAVGEGVRG